MDKKLLVVVLGCALLFFFMVNLGGGARREDREASPTTGVPRCVRTTGPLLGALFLHFFRNFFGHVTTKSNAKI